jgi:Fe-S-cluster containining protein
VTRIEATRILHWLVTRGIPAQDASRTSVDEHPFFDALSGDQDCVFIAEGGCCGIYPVRPIICRSHGLPIKLDDGRVDTCPLNFVDSIDLEYKDIPQLDLLDLHNVNVRMSLIEILYCKSQGEEPGRIPLSSVREFAEEMLDASD